MEKLNRPKKKEMLFLPKPNTFEFREISIEELTPLLNSIPIFKSSGLSSYKDAFNILSNHLLKIYNTLILTNKFPDKWKYATVVPIPKINKPVKVIDYRQISLLPLPGKLFEKLLHKQLILYLENESLLTDIQNGFRKNHNTTDTTYKFVNLIASKQNKGKAIAAIIIDFEKAFH